jgi:ADP-ribosylglycohydrolase
MMSDLRQQAINVTSGCHLGDANGAQFEMMTRQEILNATGGEGMTRPRSDFDPSARKLPDTRGLPKGSTTDDSQLFDATAEGLILAGRYVHELHVLLHLQALWHDVAGWGGTTKRSLYELDKWYRSQVKGFGGDPPPSFKKRKDEKLWTEAEPRRPTEPARWHELARGNGPSMQIGPFGIRYAMLGGGDFESGEALDEIVTFSRMTHADPICAIAAYAIAGIICDSIVETPEVAAERLMSRVRAAEATYILLHRGTDRFSDALTTALSLTDKPEALWAFGSAGRSDSLTSVPMAIAIWRRHLADAGPMPAVLEAINAGGDTDTVAAMVGAMMGAAGDRADWWPAEWLETLLDRGAKARRIGKRLHEVGSLQRPPYGYDLDEIKKDLGY